MAVEYSNISREYKEEVSYGYSYYLYIKEMTNSFLTQNKSTWHTASRI
jgi:hypothetical protein